MLSATAVGGLSSIADRFEAFLVDQYGVIHDGAKLYPGVADAMARLTGFDKTVIVLTNSGKRAEPNIARVEALGLPRSSFTTLVSSGEVTWHGLRTGAFGPPFEAGSRIHVIGRPGDDYGLDDLGLIAVAEPEAADFLVIAASDCPRTGLDAYAAALAPAAARHVPALCANPDRTMLAAGGLQPAAGAIAKVYEDLGGRVMFVGKPFTAIYHEALKRAGCAGIRVLCIGDSLDHDILGGAMAGCRTALVRTGLMDGIGDADLAVALAAAPHRPDYLLPSLTWD